MAGNKLGIVRKGDIHSRKLELDGKKLMYLTANTNTLGTYVIGDTLYDNGSIVAKSTQNNPQLVFDDGSPKFGEVELITEGKVINITLSNYNKLYNREAVAGYKYFDLWDVYRIVDDVSNAQTIHYVRDHENKKLTFDGGIEWEEQPYLLYNNVVGEQAHNDEDLENTVKIYDSPYVSVRYFNPRIQYGDTIKIPICVDNYIAQYVQGKTENGVVKQSVTGTYTIEVRNEDDNATLVRKTVYAGETVIETKPFMNIGETWFTLRCIDSNGVGSAVHYLDVMVEDPNYQENIWQVRDADLSRYGIVVDDDASNDPTVPDDGEDGTAYDTFLMNSYTNKLNFSRLFADAVNKINPLNGKKYNGVKLPTHRYMICDYKNISNEDGVIDLGNDSARYFYCEIVNVMDGDAIVTNKMTNVEELTETKVKADYKELFIEDNAVNYKKFTTSLAYKHREDYPSQIIKRTASDFVNNATEILKSNGSKYDEGKYYFVLQGNADNGDSIQFPDNFTLDLNGSTIQIVNQYDFSDAYAIEIERATNVHIRNGKIKGGLETCDWIRGVARRAYQDPFEHVIPFSLRGNRFCSFKDIVIEGSIGFTLQTEIDNYNNSRYSVPTRSNLESNGRTGYEGQGMCDNKRIDLVSGTIQDLGDYVDASAPAAERLEMFVQSTSANSYNQNNANNIQDSDIGYIQLANAADDKFIFVGRGQQWITQIGKRKEIFVFFYNESNVLIKYVKTRTSWMVRIPDGAKKVRIMGYGHSSKKSGIADDDASTWVNMGVFQVKSSTGMVYKDCTILKARSSIVGGLERQVLYDNVKFKQVASMKIINPDGVGKWSAITPKCFDLESGSVLGKYMTFNNCTAELGEIDETNQTEMERFRTDNSYFGVMTLCLQGGEEIQLTNCTFCVEDWGVQSGLFRNNTFRNMYFVDSGNHGRSLDVQRLSMFNFHPHVQWDGNTIDPHGKARSLGISVQILGHPKGDSTKNVYLQYYFNDNRETVVPFRMTTLNIADTTGYQFTSYRSDSKFQNSKDYDRYTD